MWPSEENRGSHKCGVIVVTHKSRETFEHTFRAASHKYALNSGKGSKSQKTTLKMMAHPPQKKINRINRLLKRCTTSEI